MDPITFFLKELNIPKQYRGKTEVYIVKDKMIYVAKTKWGFHTIPGGGIEPEETPEQCSHRECIEEIGVKIKDLKKMEANPFCFLSTGREGTLRFFKA